MRRLPLLLVMATVLTAASPINYPAVRPGVILHFPADHGADPAYRTGWWYVSGWLRTADGRDLGFQVTFFRTRPPVTDADPSRFSPTQVRFADAALSDPNPSRLLLTERAARAGFGVAEAGTQDADVRLVDWRLQRLPDGRFVTHVSGGGGFALSLAFRSTQPPFL